jgi:hypothetical protein
MIIDALPRALSQECAPTRVSDPYDHIDSRLHDFANAAIAASRVGS